MPDNTCICCGKIIPEGQQVCTSCEQKYTGGCTDCVHAIDDFGRCLIAKMFDCRVNPEHGCSWKVPIKRRAIQTNGDRIRAMSDKELGKWLCSMERRALFTNSMTRPEGWQKWLESEVKNELDPNH